MITKFPFIKNPDTRAKLRWIKGFAKRKLRKQRSVQPAATMWKVPGHETFFGYYDVSPMSRDQTRMLAHAVPKAIPCSKKMQSAVVGYFDTDSKEFVSIAETTSWCWQMGARLRWLPGQDDFIIFNSLENTGHVAKICDATTKKTVDEIPVSLYDISSDCRYGISLDFRRLGILRPGYGYLDNIGKSSKISKCPDNDGLWLINMADKTSKLLASYRDITSIGFNIEFENAIHYLNHISISPDGSRIMFFHLWKTTSINDHTFNGRLLQINSDGKNLIVIAEDARPSHYCWLSNTDFLVTMAVSNNGKEEYRLYRNGRNMGRYAEFLPLRDGHPSLHPFSNLLLTDSYPDTFGEQHLEVYDLDNGRSILLGKFLTNFNYQGELRCDLHPRWSPDGKRVIFDSAHQGGRTIYILDFHKTASGFQRG